MAGSGSTGSPKACPIPASGCLQRTAIGFSTLLAVGAELAVDYDDRLLSAIRDGAQDTINDAGQQIIQRQMQIAPTLTIRPGFPVRVIVTRDLVLEPYGG